MNHSKKKILNSQQILESFFSIFSYWENTNQNHFEISSQPGQKNKQQLMQRTLWGKSESYSSWQECQLGLPTWKSSQRFLRKLRLELGPNDVTIVLCTDTKHANSAQPCMFPGSPFTIPGNGISLRPINKGRDQKKKSFGHGEE